METHRNPKAGLQAMLTPDNCVLILIDHQPFQFANLHSHEPTMIVNNVVALAKTAKVFNVPDLVISPGLVDTHVHINEPGRTEWEGFDTATRAAACGGVTTLVDMPLNSVPATTCVAGLHAKMGAARAQCHVDVGFWGGVVPGNAAELDPLIDAGVRGFKCFLVPSGVDEFPAVDEGDLRQALPILARRAVPLAPQRLGAADDPGVHFGRATHPRHADSRCPRGAKGACETLQEHPGRTPGRREDQGEGECVARIGLYGQSTLAGRREERPVYRHAEEGLERRQI
jgi:allantoinase